MKKVFVLAIFLFGLTSISLKAETNLDTVIKVKDTTIIKKSAIGDTNKKVITTETVTVISNGNGKQCKTGHSKMISYGVILLIIILFVFLAFYSNILRDSVDPDTFYANAKTLPRFKDITDVSKIPRPFSLSRTQLGLWTVIIACAYIYLSSKCCWQTIAFTTNILALMGISSGTAAIGNAIDKNQSSGAAGGADRHQNQSPSEGFLTDILSDENGISIHRFQNVVFTFVGIIIFLFQVYQQNQCGKFPEPDMTLIALMGISTATYLGIKINENK